MLFCCLDEHISKTLSYEILGELSRTLSCLVWTNDGHDKKDGAWAGFNCSSNYYVLTNTFLIADSFRLGWICFLENKWRKIIPTKEFPSTLPVFLPMFTLQ